jgi:membrane protease YdiL (CAAX protease family)
MSILSAQPLAAVTETMRIGGVLIVLSALSLAFMIASRAASLRRLPGPPRIPPEQSAWPLAGVLFGAIGIYFFASSAVFAIWASLAPKYGASTQPTESDAGMALLNTIPAVFALLVVLAGDRFIYPGVRQELGFSARNFRRGVLYGIGGALLVIPLLYLASQAMEFIYHHFHYEHPSEHPLLRVLGEAPNKWVTATIILGACLLAPIFEELVFRAHLQTLLLRAFEFFDSLFLRTFNPDPQQPTADPPVVAEAADLKSEISNPQVSLVPYSDPLTPNPPHALPEVRRSSPIPSLLAILLTSFLFASVHPLWSFPIIFLLALALGYAYERTGNLWVSITMHAMFNSVSTLLFLLGAG